MPLRAFVAPPQLLPEWAHTLLGFYQVITGNQRGSLSVRQGTKQVKRLHASDSGEVWGCVKPVWKLCSFSDQVSNHLHAEPPLLTFLHTHADLMGVFLPRSATNRSLISIQRCSIVKAASFHLKFYFYFVLVLVLVY